MSSRISKSVSVKDVARLAGVSEQTVSRTVHDSPSVRLETKKRVRAAMRELGYRPNFAGRSLRRGKFKTVGVAMFNMAGTGNLDRLEGFTTAADKNDHALTLVKMGSQPPFTLEAAARRMGGLPVDGMVIVMNRMTADFGSFKPLPGLETVLVTMLEHPTCSTVDNDQFAASRTIVEHLLARGHKTVHFISCPERSLSGMQREEGWCAALQGRGIEPPRLIRGDWTAKSGYAAGQALADDPTCTAVYASNDAMAYGCILGLQSRGKSVPADVSVVGVDDSLGDVVPDLGLTTMRFDNKRVGEWAVEKIVNAGEGGAAVEHVLFPGELVERDTVRDLR
ncbi:LacI family DNA-binding transcriptional regulator [Paratractidigestivibacter sp.]|uniref:LacI family DNA-binding transcriptional regulator n=1 Tax=Paratractidigestivibacter sp. TaxID=2847316 RepID=UPI002ABD9FC0|nr:LacI family DNA-binding transcriptional regulator [Paratractidigestivibacter sp.]